MIITILKIKTLPTKRKEALDILLSLKGPLNAQKDCLDSTIYELHKENGKILYMEQWQNEESLNRHIQSDLYLRILAVMDTAAEKPDISFIELTGSKGMDFIRSLRFRQENRTKTS